MGKGMKTLVIVGGILLVGAWLVSWGLARYNGVIRMDEDVKEKWAQVENQLKRRYDLIPNLVETVKGFAAHEQGIFTAIAEARTKYFAAQSVGDKVAASRGLEGALSRLLLLQEAYPQLKANENFLKLQDSLEGTENRIAVERMRYNEAVKLLNAYVRGFPGNIFAGLARVQQAVYYDLPAGQEQVPQVKFN
ncbi:MAG TPA: LemA family protein [Candidatus Methanoperedens sp.]|nr:LemA family protein [Candidatus Methanoperedens sp.]